MKKKLLIIIVLVITVLTVIGCGIVFWKKYNKDKHYEDNNKEEMNLSYTIPLEKELKKIESEYDFGYVINCVNKYYETLKTKNEKKIKGLIDEKYIKQFKMFDKNISNYYIYIDNVYMNEQKENLSTYIVTLNIIDLKTKSITQETIVLRIDFFNETFSVVPIEYIENINDMSIGSNFEISQEEINANEYNKLDDIKGSRYYVLAEYYYNTMKNLSLYNIEEAYSMLDEEYKTKNCNTVEKYKEIEKNLFDKNTKITDYRRRVNSNQDIVFECKDSKNNEYIIIIDYQEDGLTDFTFYKR